MMPSQPKASDRVRCTLHQFSDWQPLSAGSQANRYTAKDSNDGLLVTITLLPWLKNNLDGAEAVSNQVRLIPSVLKGYPSIRALDLDSDTPFIAQTTFPGIPLSSFLATASAEQRLRLVAALLFTISGGIQSRLYHGALSVETIQVVANDDQLSIVIDYLARFYSAPTHVRNTVFDLYQSDVKNAISIASELVQQTITSGEIDSVIQGRKLAILKSMLRKRFEERSLDDQFEEWLGYFAEWRPEVAQVHREGNLDLARTQEVDAFHGWQNAGVANKFSLDTAEVNVDSSSICPNQSDSGTSESQIQTTIAASTEPFIGTMLGRFRLEKLLGQGGMGAVYRGIDTTNQTTVAVKVLHHRGADSDQAVRRFKKEARILASVRNDHVTQLFEVGVARDVHYIAMEFVDGVNLKDWIRDKLPLEERTALLIVADIARALVEAHHRRIIHRDIKPENVLLARKANAHLKTDDCDCDIHSYVIKLTDFGIARQIEQSDSMEVTRAGTFLGTPRYMSPEQCKGGRHVDASTDVYSLGITLYELLTGSVPFHDMDAMKLAAMHCFDPVPDLRRRNSKLSEPTIQLVYRMLSKNTADRFSDASQLLEELQRIIDGKPNAFEAHPHLPEFDRSKLWERVFEWDLKSSPDQLWPHVTNTERLNRAAGLPAVEYRIVKDPVRGIRRFGSFRLGGIKIEWEEHPFEWIEGSKMGVVREFSSGPFKWFMNTVELKPNPEGGSRLIHKVQIEPRNTLGRVVSTIEAGWKGGKALDRIYKRIDESVQATLQSSQVFDAFEKPISVSRWKRSRIESRADEMIRMGADPEATEKLAEYVISAATQELNKIRPTALAGRLGIRSTVMLDTCLIAAKANLLVLQWDILCPTCRVATKSETILSRIKQHTDCESCDTQFQSNIGNAIELVFRVHSELRDLENGRFCIGGPWHAPHVVTQIRIAPKEHMSVPIRLSQGDYYLRCIGSAAPTLFSVRTGASEHRIEYRVPESDGPRVSEIVNEGFVTLVLSNESDVARTVRLERTIERDNSVTATEISAHPRFRELFPDQSFDPNSPITSEELSLLVSQVNNMDQLYQSLGDYEAYDLIQQLLKELEREIIQARGALVKTVGELVLASFQDCESACQAAISIQRLIKSKYSSQQIKNGICVHRGQTLIAHQNGRLDYFGATIRKLSNLVTQADDAALFTDSVYSDPVVCQALKDSSIQADTILVESSGFSPQIVQRIQIR